MEIERRSIDGAELRLVESEDGAPPRIVGRAVPYGTASQMLWDWEYGQFVERFVAGAFTESLAAGGDVRARIEHEDGLMLIGRTSSGTLQLDDREDGLYYDVIPPDTSAARDLTALVRRGDIRGSSFAFTVPEGGDSWRKLNSELYERTVTRANLLDVAPVSNPAYLDTSVAVRKLQEMRATDETPTPPGVHRRAAARRLVIARRR